MKKLISIILLLVLSITCCGPAFAATNLSINDAELYVNLPIINADEFDPNNVEQITYLNAAGEIVPNADAGVVGFFLIRSGNTSSVEVYFQWAGTDLLNAVRCTKLVVDNGSILNNVVYDTLEIGSGIYTVWNFTASVAGTKKLHDISIPVDETEARVRVSNLYVYTLEGGWRSVSYLGKMGEIN